MPTISNAGGYFVFGPTFDSTKYVRAAYEGVINGIYDADVATLQPIGDTLAGRFAAMTTDGTVTVAGDKGKGAVGLIREDLKDMINASNKVSFYQLGSGGEYHVAASRLGDDIENFAVGSDITTNAEGQIIPASDGDKVVGTVVSVGEFRRGNMYEWAGEDGNGGLFLGFIMHV